MNQAVFELWHDILKRFPDDASESVRGAATPDELNCLSAALKREVPDDLATVLQISNGLAWHPKGLFPPLLSCKEIADQYKQCLTYRSPNSTVTFEDLPYSGEWCSDVFIFAEIDSCGFVYRLDNSEIWRWDHDGWTFSRKAANLEELLRSTLDQFGAPEWCA